MGSGVEMSSRMEVLDDWGSASVPNLNITMFAGDHGLFSWPKTRNISIVLMVNETHFNNCTITADFDDWLEVPFDNLHQCNADKSYCLYITFTATDTLPFYYLHGNNRTECLANRAKVAIQRGNDSYKVVELERSVDPLGTPKTVSLDYFSEKVLIVIKDSLPLFYLPQGDVDAIEACKNGDLDYPYDKISQNVFTCEYSETYGNYTEYAGYNCTFFIPEVDVTNPYYGEYYFITDCQQGATLSITITAPNYISPDGALLNIYSDFEDNWLTSGFYDTLTIEESDKIIFFKWPRDLNAEHQFFVTTNQNQFLF